ncbi:hypothetical protein AL036_05300 [Salipiger aestuarii]|uniref:SDR family NAD(P)-dependent oxidoreductase n=1 Tax=Salipiger aestuarii TaxID=568098 RepID=UPI001239687D|nr:SDR family NAD(P)-dependent oxidoreductase [Salipiger aestuarii]KAA8609129.1 hypothetical protein AL036_05300 [Salipiger aestuarii]KAA8614331.1 hypothetical protein AL037_03895 [Salipiger aestuarii]
MTRLFGVSVFTGKVVLVSGAGHPLGRAMVRRLSGFGARIVAIDTEAQAMHRLAAHRPDRIEPLALDLTDPEACMILGESWGGEPLHLVYDFSALSAGKGGIGQVAARSDGLLTSIARGLRAGPGRAIVGLPDDEDGAVSGMLAAMVRQWNAALAPAKLHGVTISGATKHWTAARLTSSGDLMLALSHPVTRALAGGVVMKDGAWAEATGKDDDGGC